MSVDALAAAWARQEAAPHGSVVTVATEIAGRRRGGIPWTIGKPDGLMMAMVTRPRIEPRQEALLWLAVTLAAAEAIEAVSGRLHRVLWPDSVSNIEADPVCYTNVGVQLDPSRIEHAVLSVRADLNRAGIDDRERLLTELIAALEVTMAQLEADPLVVMETFSESYALIDRPVTATLLPRGSARGRIAAIDHNGDLVLESTTGMLERIMASKLRHVEPA
jgi:biotin-(acetyl-CoA carboxylase) ligase